VEAMHSKMRNPYVVGRWVRGHNHYGRQRLIDYLLATPDSATWLVGTRRMGKTSLLRQIELVTANGDSPFVPVYWDLQGCRNSGEMAAELAYALEETQQRFQARGVEVNPGAIEDAADALRMLGRGAARANVRPLLLIDEAEALIPIAAAEQAWLAKLRKALQEGNLRCIVTSTKLLAQLNEMNAGWTTSPFLFGFNLANLWQLDLEAAHALIRQEQSPNPVQVEDALAEEILNHTNGHPYLIQYLCHRLFVVDDRRRGVLRDLVDDDLNPDQLLSGFFRIDFQYLTRVERRLLLTISGLSVAKREEIMAALSDEPPQRVDTFLYGLRKLGYLRRLRERWAVGNEFLRRWLQDQRAELAALAEPPVGDAVHEEILRAGRDNELVYLRYEIDELQAELSRMLAQQPDEQPRFDAATRREIERIRLDLSNARKEVVRIQDGA